MKKLMIAAAAAAMIGGAQADLVYDLTACLKTTSAKASTSSATYTYNFGFGWKSGTSPREYWYDAAVFTPNGQYLDWTDGTYSAEKLIKTETKTGRGSIVSSVWNKLTQEAKLAFVASLADYANYYDPANPSKSVTDSSYFTLAPTFTGEKDDYRGSDKWCMSIKWSNKVTDTACYRVAGSVKLVARYSVANCCGTAAWAADATYAKTAPSWITDSDFCIDINPILSYRFGSLTLEKATRAEFVAKIGDATDSTKLPQLTIAGQGSVATVKDKTGAKSAQPEISSICGNVAGVWVDPVCDVCCGNSPDAMVFDCTEDPTLWDGAGNLGGRASNDIKTVGDANVAEPIFANAYVDGSLNNLWGTAGYGTFTLKYNQKESEF